MKKQYEIVEIDGIGYMFVKVAAERLQVTPGRVRQLVLDGRLESRKGGDSLLVTLDSIEDYERTRKSVGRPAGTIARAPNKNVATQRANWRDAQERSRKRREE